MKHSFKKLTAWLCCMAMLISFIPATALPVFAAGETVTYTEDTDGVLTADDFAATGAVKLTKTTTASAQITVAADQHWYLDLNGQTLTLDTVKTLFRVSGGETLTLTDSATGGILTRDASLSGDNNGLIYIDGGTFNMEGGTITGLKSAGRGTVSRLYQGVFNMSGGTITGNTTSYQGGAIFIGDNGTSSTATFTMTGGTISGNSATNGGAIAIGKGGTNTANIEGGIIDGNTATENGGAIHVAVAGQSFLNISGDAEITDNTATKSGGGVYNAGTVVLDGGTIDGNTATVSGGGVYNATADSVFEMESGYLTNNVATTKNGGGVLADKAGATITISGGTISGNSAVAANGGGVCGLEAGGQFANITISGGTIENNHASVRGANLYGYDDNITITGGTIGAGTYGASNANATQFRNVQLRGCKLVVSGGNISNIDTASNAGSTAGSIAITGNPEIAYLSVRDGATTSIGSLTAGASISTSAADVLTVTDDGTVKVDGKVYSFNAPTYTVTVGEVSNGTVDVEPASGVAGTTVTVTATPDDGYELVEILVDGKAITGTTFTITGNHTVTATFEAGKVTLPFTGTVPAGEYVLEADHVLTGGLIIAKGTEVTIDLAGNTISLSDEVTPVPAFFNVAAGGKLTIKDSVGSGKVQFKESAGGNPGVTLQGTFVLDGGELTGWTRASAGGTINIYTGATFIMNGGKITGASATGYAVMRSFNNSAETGMTVELNGGEISNNVSTGASRIIEIGINGKPSTVKIGGNFKMSGNKHSSTKEFTADTTAFQIYDAIVTIGGNAQVDYLTLNNGTLNSEGGEYNAENGDTRYGRIDVSGSPVVAGIYRSTTGIKVNISNLTASASIKTTNNAPAQSFDDTVASEAYDNSATSGIAKDKGIHYFYKVVYTVSVGDVSNGTVTVDPASGVAGTEVTVTATPAEGYELTAILVDGEPIDGTTFTITGNHTVTATFEAAEPEVPTLPTSGTVPAGEYVLEGDHVLAGGLTIAAGTEVTIDLAGNTISMPDKDAVYFVINGKLTIKDSVSGGKVQFKNTTAGHPGINVSGEFVLAGGELNGWTRVNNGAYGAGALIFLNANSKFTMTGGLITDCDCNGNTVIRTAGNANARVGNIVVSITGGTITGNNAHANNIIDMSTLSVDAPGTLIIGGTANISGNTCAEAAYTRAAHEIAVTNTTVTVGGTATVGNLYAASTNALGEDNKQVEGQFYSSITVTGAPTINSVRMDGSAKSPLYINNLTEDASIKTGNGAAAAGIDSTVASAAYDDSAATGVTQDKGTHYTYKAPVTTPELGQSDFAAPGTITLTDATVLTEAVNITVAGEYVIDLAGNTLTGTAAPYFTVGAGVTLIVKDDVGEGKIQGISAADAMIVVNGGTFQLDGGILTGHTNTSTSIYGGAIRIADVATSAVVINDGSITGNTAERGGAIAFKEGASNFATLTINGGEITANTAVRGGANLYTQMGATIVMTGGSIGTGTVGGEAATSSNNNWLRNANITISGGEIASMYYLSQDLEKYHMTVTGDSVIGGLYRTNVDMITVKELSEGAEIVWHKDAANNTTAPAAGDDTVAVTVAEDGNTATITYKAPPAALPASGTLTAGNYYVAEDLTLTNTIVINTEVTIDLAGHTITAPEGGMAFNITTNDTAHLTIKDSEGGGKVVSGASEGNPAIFVQKGSFTLDGGEITGWNRAGKAGGMIYLLANTTFVMNGGKLTGASCANASAIRTTAGATVTMNGGEISGNTTETYGPIYINSGVTFTMNGGTITGNSAGTEGGAIYNLGTVTINDGTISNNTATKNGGAIYNLGTVNIAGGTITGNTATVAGGAIYNSQGTVTIGGENTVVSNNTATSNGGAIYNVGTVTINGGTFTGNTGAWGGVVCVMEGSTTTITGGTFTGNTGKRGATIASAEVVVTDETKYPVLTISGGTFDNNHAGEYGAVMYFYTTKLTISGGTFGGGTYSDANTTSAGGRNMWLRTCITNISGGNFKSFGVNNGTLAITGNPVIADLAAAATTNTIGSLTSGASVTVTANDALTVQDGTVHHVDSTKLYRCVDDVDMGLTADKFVDGKTVTLTDDSTVGAGIVLAAGTYTLDLAGFTLTGDAAPYFTIGADVKLIITDSSEAKTGKVVGLTSAANAMIYVNGGTFELAGGTLTGHTSTKNGAAINVNAGSVIVSGGKITGNTAQPTITYNEGTDKYAYANGYGGAIFLAKGTSVTMTAGEISGNTAYRGGGITGVEAGSSNVVITLTGGTIKDNISYDRGGNLYAYDPATVTLGAVTIGTSYDKSHNNTPSDFADDTVTETQLASAYRNIELRGGTITVKDSNIKAISMSKGSAGTTTAITGATKIELLNKNAVATVTIGSLTTGARVATDSNYILTGTGEEGAFDATVNVQARLYRFAGDVKRLLIVGNSFAGDTTTYLTQVAALFGHEVDSAYLYIGSQTVRQHAMSLAETLRNEDLNSDGVIGDSRHSKDGAEGLYSCAGFTGSVTIPDVMEGAKWDYVVLQPGVEYVGFEGTYNSDIDFLMDYIQTKQPDAKIYWSQTWAMDNRSWSTQANPDKPDEVAAGGKWVESSSYLTQFGGSQTAMYNAILANTDKFISGDDARFGAGATNGNQFYDWFPIGIAVQTMRNNYSDSYLTRDGFHLSYNAGRMIAAMTVVKTLFPEVDLTTLTTEQVVGLFADTTLTDTNETNDHLADLFDPTEANVDVLIAAVNTACEGKADIAAANTGNAANKVFNPDATIKAGDEFVVTYENVTELGQGEKRVTAFEVENVLHDTYASAGAGKLVVYKNGTAIATIDELWLEENVGIELTNRYANVNGQYYIMADAQAPQLVTVGETLVLVFDVKLYSDNGVVTNDGIHMATSTNGVDWTYVAKVGDYPMAYGLTALSDDTLLMSVKGQTTSVLKLTTDGVVTDTVELAGAGVADVAFAELGDTIYALSSNGIIYGSTDAGLSWENLTLCANFAANNPGMVKANDDTLYLTWEAGQAIYGKIWTVSDHDRDLGYSGTEAVKIADIEAGIAFNGALSGAQADIIAVDGGVKLVYASGDALNDTEADVYTGIYHSLALESSLGINYLVKKADVDAMGADEFKVNPGNNEYTYPKRLWKVVTANGEEYYQVRWTGIAAKEMGEIVRFGVFKDDVLVSALDYYSVKQYAENKLAEHANAEAGTSGALLRTMLVDMLNYGAAAQINFSHLTDELVNAGLTAEQKAWASAAPALTANGFVTTGVRCGKNLSLEDTVEINLSYVRDAGAVASATYAKVTYTPHNGTEAVTEWIELVDSAIGDEITKMVKIDTLASADVSTQVTVELYDAKEGNPIADTACVYSIEYYAYIKNQANPESSIAKLGVELMKYGNAAKAYLPTVAR